MAQQINEKDFNGYRIAKGEKEAVLPALQDTFKILWKKEFPEQPWTNDKASVELFEENVKNACKQRAVSRRSSQKEEQKINRILADLNKDQSWYKCDWDISTLSKVLVDCRLFDLEEISVELSDHIKGIKDIRNKMAHTTAFGIAEQEFKDTMKSLKKHLEGLGCEISVDHYLQTLEQLESQDMPTSTDQLKDMRYEIEIMKITLKWSEEKEKTMKITLKLSEEKEKRVREREKNQKEKHDLENQINNLKTENTILMKDMNNLKERLNELESHYQEEFFLTNLMKRFCPCLFVKTTTSKQKRQLKSQGPFNEFSR